jgi:hypothetical protein
MLGVAKLLAKAKLKVPDWVDDPKAWRRIHATITWMWIVQIPPGLIWWRESVPYLVFMSLWANIAGHLAAWQGSRAECKEAEMNEK